MSNCLTLRQILDGYFYVKEAFSSYAQVAEKALNDKSMYSTK